MTFSEECTLYVIKTWIILQSLINKKGNIWQTHFRSVFKTGYIRSSIRKWLLNLPLKLSLCLDTSPPGCLILTHVAITLVFLLDLLFLIFLWDSLECIFQGPNIISLLTFEVFEVLHLARTILFLVCCSPWRGSTILARGAAKTTDNVSVFPCGTEPQLQLQLFLESLVNSPRMRAQLD